MSIISVLFITFLWSGICGMCGIYILEFRVGVLIFFCLWVNIYGSGFNPYSILVIKVYTSVNELCKGSMQRPHRG